MIGDRLLIREEEKGKKILLTKNLTPGITYYREKTVEINGVEYRIWSPYRSKLAAAILNGLDPRILKDVKKILYLGAATGTTISHISDLLPHAIIYAVEVAPRVMLEFINRVTANRPNIIPLYYDARKPMLYLDIVDKVDLVYCDVAQPDQTEIAAYNSDIFLKQNGKMLLAVKSRSIDVTKSPSEIYKQEAKYLEKRGYNIINIINLEPYEKDHAMIYSIKRK